MSQVGRRIRRRVRLENSYGESKAPFLSMCLTFATCFNEAKVPGTNSVAKQKLYGHMIRRRATWYSSSF